MLATFFVCKNFGLSTSRLAIGRMNFDLSTGQLSRGISTEIGLSRCRIGRGFDLSVFTVEGGLKSHIFLHLFFLLEALFPATSRKKSSNFLPRVRTYPFSMERGRNKEEIPIARPPLGILMKLIRAVLIVPQTPDTLNKQNWLILESSETPGYKWKLITFLISCAINTRPCGNDFYPICVL